jgi:hypothetical protein
VKARLLIGNRAYGPDTLKVLFKAFDDAWDAVAPDVSSRAEAIEAARLKLANIILSLASEDSNDAERIKDTALQVMAAIGYRVGKEPSSGIE